MRLIKTGGQIQEGGKNGRMITKANELGVIG